MSLFNDEFNFETLLNLQPSIIKANKKQLGDKILLPKSHSRSINIKDIPDDFYSSLLDWDDEKIFFSKGDAVYLYNYYSETCNKLFDSSSVITSIKYNSSSNKLISGDTLGTINYFDLGSFKSYKISAHRSRIGVIKHFDSSSNCNKVSKSHPFNGCIVTGSRDRKAKIFDSRIKEPVCTMNSHFQEVCGLAASNDLIATGGNDNVIFIYKAGESHHKYQIHAHKAAIKALDWSDDGRMLASGGGSADKSIRVHKIYNKSPELIKALQFDSQITNIKWVGENSMLSCFGYCNNDIKLIKDYKVIKTYEGHDNRVIHFSMRGNNKNNNNFVTASNDGKIKMWEI